VNTFTEFDGSGRGFVFSYHAVSSEPSAWLCRLRAVVPPARVPHALEQCGSVRVDEVDVTADGLFEQREHSPARILRRHGLKDIGEVFDKFEDHGGPEPSRENTCKKPLAKPTHAALLRSACTNSSGKGRNAAGRPVSNASTNSSAQTGSTVACHAYNLLRLCGQTALAENESLPPEN